MKKNVFLLISIIAIGIIACNTNSSSTGSTGKGGSMARFTIKGNYLYTVSTSDIDIYDLSTESSPQSINTINLPGYIETITARDTLLFFGTRQGMLIYNNSNPTSPEFISEYSHIYSCDPVVVQGDYAYVTMNTLWSRCGIQNNRLDIVDISDLKNPVGVAEYPMTSPLGLGIESNTLFLCDEGLKIYDVSDPQDIELLAYFRKDGYDIITDYGNIFLIGSDGFYQYKFDPVERSIILLSSIKVDDI